MANNLGNIEINDTDLNESFHKYRTDLIKMPVYALESALKYMTFRPGVRHKETVGELQGKMELSPFNADKEPNGNVDIIARTLETFLGNDIQPFNPSSIVKSILGSEFLLAEDVKNIPITKKVWTFLMGLCGESLFNAMFTAKRDEHGKTSATLFDGFCTIADDEKTKGNISAEKGNYFKITEQISKVNAVDIIEEVHDSASNKLKGIKTNFFLSPNAYTHYCKDYRERFGNLNYNEEFKKVFVDGSNDMCALVPLPNMPDGKFIITTKGNMLVGGAWNGPDIGFRVEKSLKSHYKLDLIADMFFGTQYQSINKDLLLYATTEVV